MIQYLQYYNKQDFRVLHLRIANMDAKHTSKGHSKLIPFPPAIQMFASCYTCEFRVGL